MSRNHILHFTIGPVQGFIEQARRTRDFWAGSFLLAWLSSVAMKTAADDLGAEIAFPRIADDDMIKALRAAGGPRQGPPIGTVPNRFKARVEGDFKAEAVKQAVHDAWWELGEAVWKTFVGDIAAAQGPDTRRIWERQIRGFWEIAWAIGCDPGDGSDGDWLDLRKNWRCHRPPTEAGDHCTVMGDWQEISGWTGHADRREHNSRQSDFWDAIRNQQRVGELNLVAGERLCAIALVRRLFPVLRLQDLPGSLWETRANWPSTGHMAAVRWVADAVKKRPVACQTYYDFIRKDLVPEPRKRRQWARAERQTPVLCLRSIQPFPEFAGIDANLFFRDDIINRRTLPLGDEPDRSIGPARRRLLEKHEDLGRALQWVGLSAEPRPYYALLRMDGDGVGKLLGERDGETVVGDALEKFVREVRRIVKQHDGVLVYAGGDDVLALLPIDKALPVAMRLETAYHGSFKKNWPVPDKTPTISASIVFADHHEPLRAVLRESHRLLDEVAKARNDRGSLAVGVLKPSGRAVEWVSAWHAGDRSVPDAVVQLSKRLTGNDRDISARFGYTLNRRFFATLGERFPDLALKPVELDGILRATLGKRRDEDDPARERDLDALVQELLLVGSPHPGPSRAPRPDVVKFSTHGVRLAFFLAGRDGAEERAAT